MTKIQQLTSRIRRSRGFTIIEMLVVVVIIGILSTIAFLSYSNIQRTMAESGLKADLNSASADVESTALVGGAYALSPSFSPSPANTISPPVSTLAATYCISGYNAKFNLSWYVTKKDGIQKGDCTSQGYLNPAAPTTTTVSTVTNKINWVTFNGAATYSLQFSSDSGFNNPSTIYTGPALAFTQNGLSINTTYYYRLKASSANGRSTGWSSIVSQKTQDASAPTNLALSTPSQTKVYAGWDTVASANSYDYQIATDAGFSQNLSTGNTTSTSVTNTGRAANTQQYFRVRSVAAGGTGSWSGTATITTPAPSAPTNVNASTASSTAINIGWSGQEGATGYDLQIATDSNFTQNVQTSYNYNGTGFGWNGLSQGTTYYARVRSLANNFASGWVGNPSASTPVDAPGNFNIDLDTGDGNMHFYARATCPSGTSVNFDWFTYDENNNGGPWFNGGYNPTYGLDYGQYRRGAANARCQANGVNSNWVGANNSPSYRRPVPNPSGGWMSIRSIGGGADSNGWYDDGSWIKHLYIHWNNNPCPVGTPVFDWYDHGNKFVYTVANAYDVDIRNDSYTGDYYRPGNDTYLTTWAYCNYNGQNSGWTMLQQGVVWRPQVPDAQSYRVAVSNTSASPNMWACAYNSAPGGGIGTCPSGKVVCPYGTPYIDWYDGPRLSGGGTSDVSTTNPWGLSAGDGSHSALAWTRCHSNGDGSGWQASANRYKRSTGGTITWCNYDNNQSTTNCNSTYK